MRYPRCSPSKQALGVPHPDPNSYCFLGPKQILAGAILELSRQRLDRYRGRRAHQAPVTRHGVNAYDPTSGVILAFAFLSIETTHPNATSPYVFEQSAG